MIFHEGQYVINRFEEEFGEAEEMVFLRYEISIWGYGSFEGFHDVVMQDLWGNIITGCKESLWPLYGRHVLTEIKRSKYD